MDLKASLLTIAEAYCRETGMSKARLATLVANDGKFFARVEGGGGFTVQTFERCMRWLAAHWPDHAEWPGSVERPAQPAEAA
jgi:hypothetical protein